MQKTNILKRYSSFAVSTAGLSIGMEIKFNPGHNRNPAHAGAVGVGVGVYITGVGVRKVRS